jgi:DNA-binding response OmpR family regulator
MDAVQKTIMVVDDEEDVRNTVQTTLKIDGYKVITAENGDECLKKLPRQKIDLILLDIMMPGKPVEDVIKSIRQTKIILLSVVRKEEAVRERLMRSKNVVGYIEKPFEIDDLLNKVRQAVKGRQ